MREIEGGVLAAAVRTASGDGGRWRDGEAAGV